MITKIKKIFFFWGTLFLIGFTCVVIYAIMNSGETIVFDRVEFVQTPIDGNENSKNWTMCLSVGEGRNKQEKIIQGLYGDYVKDFGDYNSIPVQFEVKGINADKEMEVNFRMSSDPMSACGELAEKSFQHFINVPGDIGLNDLAGKHKEVLIDGGGFWAIKLYYHYE